jgi:hypothetical protein
MRVDSKNPVMDTQRVCPIEPALRGEGRSGYQE